jgi:hypothetical protein
MTARVPLDVDLEDRLIYGLTPVRFGYLVAASLLGLATWSTNWLPVVIRAPLAGLVIAAGAAVAWGRFGGRPVDGWLSDMARFAVLNYRLELNLGPLTRWGGRLIRRSRVHTGEPEWRDGCCSPGLDLPP